jgi:hypothetical protein
MENPRTFSKCGQIKVNGLINGGADMQGTKPGDIWTQILTFLYTIAHQIGEWVLRLLQTLFPQAALPMELADPIGFLVLLTVFVVLAQAARKIAWYILIVGWVLIVIRLIMAFFGYGRP